MTHPTWALGFEDEVWWSRLAQPEQHCWTDAEATQKLQELTPATDDPDPKALACYGLLVRPGRPQAVACIDGWTKGKAPLPQFKLGKRNGEGYRSSISSRCSAGRRRSARLKGWR